MNDQKPVAKDSLCWNCKFGVCIQETERERFVHPGMHAPEDPFAQPEFDEEAMPDIIEHVISHERVKTICFWKPEGVTQSPPIIVSFVNSCSRFEKK